MDYTLEMIIDHSGRIIKDPIKLTYIARDQRELTNQLAKQPSN